MKSCLTPGKKHEIQLKYQKPRPLIFVPSQVFDGHEKFCAMENKLKQPQKKRIVYSYCNHEKALECSTMKKKH